MSLRRRHNWYPHQLVAYVLDQQNLSDGTAYPSTSGNSLVIRILQYLREEFIWKRGHECPRTAKDVHTHGLNRFSGFLAEP